MKIDGLLIATEIKKGLIKQIEELRSGNILPHLAVILIGNDPASATYVKRKEILAKEIGARISIFKFSYEADHLKDTPLEKKFLCLVNKLNIDQSIHGIIIQRPVPLSLTNKELDNLVTPAKDVDGFHPNSLFDPPVASAVLHILNYVFVRIQNESLNFMKWLKTQKILLIGRGETAGKPIASYFDKLKINYYLAHSQTNNLKKLCLEAKIIISCVGKPNIVRPGMINDDSILIGVGLHPEQMKLQTDYPQEKMSERKIYYTPVPGGVGPVNVACLFSNLIKAAYNQTS